MTMAGFEIDAEPDAHRLLTSFCPFGTTAIAHPEVVCSLDRGMVTGLLEALHQDWRPVTLTPTPATPRRRHKHLVGSRKSDDTGVTTGRRQPNHPGVVYPGTMRSGFRLFLPSSVLVTQPSTHLAITFRWISEVPS